LDYSIIDGIIKERKKITDDIIACRNELDRLVLYKKNFKIDDLLPANKEDDQPWDRIDRILNAFGLLIRVDRMNLNAGLEFLRFTPSNNSETLLEIKQLSSGEKVAFALALWTWGNSKGQKTDILLIDEFDAHLNPSIAEKFIAVIKEYFVNLGVQVIMTTHNPSTVAYAKSAGADIIWMVDGLIDAEVTYENIIRDLSNGLIDINYLTEEMHLLIENRERCVIYTEGKTDRTHI
jgi:DNA repair ATPase RecN